MSQERVRLRADRLEWRKLGSEIVALDVADSTYLTVGPVGAAMWPQLVEGAHFDELVGVVLQEFEVEEETARRDIAAFLDELHQHDLLER